MEETLFTFMKEASISIATVAALLYVVRSFLLHIKEQSAEHRVVMAEREEAFRSLEKEIRDGYVQIINQSTIAISENTRALERSTQVHETITRVLERKI